MFELVHLHRFTYLFIALVHPPSSLITDEDLNLSFFKIRKPIHLLPRRFRATFLESECSGNGNGNDKEFMRAFSNLHVQEVFSPRLGQ